MPVAVEIDGELFEIRNKCDYRVVLDVIVALNDDELDMETRVKCALLIFYEDLSKCKNFDEAVKQMFKIINNGKENEENEQSPKIMDWEHDFSLIAPPVSRVLGYSVRDTKNYTHFYDFIGAYMEIGECNFSNVISIRKKRMKGQKLDKCEKEFYKNNKSIVELPKKISQEEQSWLDSDW